MAKLKALRPQVSSLGSSINYLPSQTPGIERERPSQSTKGWYNLARWKKLRWATFVRDKFTCQMCGKMSAPEGTLVCDHVEPHRGNERLFWNPNNLQTLCKSPCHDKHKQRMERNQGGV